MIRLVRMTIGKVHLETSQIVEVLEQYIVPAGSWIQTEHLGMQIAVPCKRPTVIYFEKTYLQEFFKTFESKPVLACVVEELKNEKKEGG